MMEPYTAAALILVLAAFAAFMIYLGKEVRQIKQMLSAIIEGGKFAMPKVTDGMRNGFELTIMALKLAGGKIAELAKPKRKIKNLDKTPIIPDVDETTQRRFYAKLMELHHSGTDYKMTEDYWYPDIWQKIGGTSKEQMRKVFDRAEADGVLKRGNPTAKNSTRVLASYATLRRKL